MANFLIVDENNKALNCIFLDIPKGGRLVEYDGPLYAEGVFDGQNVRPREVEMVIDAAIVDGLAKV